MIIEQKTTNFKVTQYKLLTEEYASTLQMLVNDHLRDGWILWGGPSVALRESGHPSKAYIQAMVR